MVGTWSGGPPQTRESLDELWHEYAETGDQTVRNRLVLSLAPLVKQIVFKRGRRMPRHCEIDDFLSAGLEALIRALDRYEPVHGVGLEQFVWTRVHGAVLDEARRQDWAPRSLRAFMRDRDRFVREHTAVHGRAPDRLDLAGALAMTPGELADWEARAGNADLHSLNMPVGAADDEDDGTELVDTLCSPDLASRPEEAVLSDALDGRVESALDELCPRDREIAELLYVEDRTMREVGQLLGVTESRVSQLNSRIKRTVERALVAA
jgi:RNA polymerase sigma factor for flagellar operon FliA